MDERPSVGVGIIVRKDGEVLLGERTAKHGAGTWMMPGGHLEVGESIEECAKRETREEAGIEIENVEFATATNDIFEEDGEHYITLFVVADHAGGEPRVREPEKCGGWEWCAWDDLPQPLFLPIENLLEKGFDPFED